MAAPMIPPPSAADFLGRHGWAGASIAPLAGDASFRRYFRVIDGARTAVLMDAPPPHEDVRPFLAIAAHLEAIGLSAPAIYAADPQTGFVLLEDYGDDRLTPLLARRPELEPELYATAIDLLAELQRHALPAHVPDYDLNELRREVLLFTDWYLPALGPTTKPGAADPGGFLDAWNGAFAYAVGWPGVLVLRDYHADNLMWLPDRPGIGALGLLDFQDARVGQRAYDLVSLLQDARRDVSPELETAMIARFVEAIKPRDPARFAASYAVLGAQRQTKILGIFARLWKRDGKPAYLKLMPRVWAHLERDLAHPALLPVARWFQTNISPEHRAAAWADA